MSKYLAKSMSYVSPSTKDEEKANAILKASIASRAREVIHRNHVMVPGPVNRAYKKELLDLKYELHDFGTEFQDLILECLDRYLYTCYLEPIPQDSHP
jgi:hypothetical protein